MNVAADGAAMPRNTLIGGAGKLAETDSKSELDRLASFVTHQEELIAELSMRLRTVSHATPQDQETAMPPEEFHLSAFIDRIRRNNDKLKTIHHELAI